MTRVRLHTLRNVLQLIRGAEHEIQRVIELRELGSSIAQEGIALEEDILLGEALVGLVQASSRLRTALPPRN